MEQKKPNFHNDPGTWQTGRTEPPKRHSALISILLVLVILLSGIATALSILNFKLYKELTMPKSPPSVSFSRGTDSPQEVISHGEDLQIPQLGIHGTTIPPVYQRYYKLPQGLYITKVISGSQAAGSGLVTGDIITAINAEPIADDHSVEDLLDDLDAGDALELTLYRSGSTFITPLIWED